MRIFHPSFETVRTFVDGELPAGKRSRVAAHLAACARCRSRADRIEQVRRIAREGLAGEAPAGAWGVIAERVRSGEVVLVPDGRRRGSAMTGRRGMVGWRAAVLGVGLASAAAALPGSPVRSWISSVGRGVAESPREADHGTADGDALAETVLVVPMVDGGVQIEVERPARELIVRARLTDQRDVEVRVRGEATGARFRSAEGRLVIQDIGGGELVVGLPAQSEAVTLVVDGATLLERRGAELSIRATTADTTGSELVIPVRPRYGPGRETKE